MADISQIKLPNNTTYNLKDNKKTGIYYVKGTQTAATGAWTGNIDVPALYTGLTIMYYLPYAGSGDATLNLTLSDGTATGAKNCYITTGRLTTHYGAGRNIIMTYYKAGDISINGTATTDDRWICDAYYDTNDHYYLRRAQTNILAGPNKIFPYTIIMQVADGRWESIVTSSTTGTSKARNTHGFRLGQILFMYANAVYNENVRVANNIWDHYTSALDHRYSFNTANNATNGTTANKPIYIVGALNATDGLFYLDAIWWTQTLPSADDGKLYIYIGDAYDYYRMNFVVNHPIYWYKNGAVRLFAQDAATVTGHTVAKDVPSNAVFTDTNNRKSFFGTCSTAAATAAKVVTLSDADGWELKAGTVIGVKFSVSNSASNVTLNVNGTGAKSIYYNNAVYTSTSTMICGFENRITYYMYDGTHWVWMAYSVDTNSNNAVTQTATTTDANYEVLFSATADNTTRTEGARKNSNLKFNPSTGNLQITQLNGVTVGDSPEFTDHTYTGTGLISVNSSGVISTSATANTGTVTKVSTGAGLTGGDITSSGTIKADIKNETKSSLTAQVMGSMTGRQYAVGLDYNGDLSVNIPWLEPPIANKINSVALSNTSVANNTFTRVGDQYIISDFDADATGTNYSARFLLMGYVSFSSAAAGKIMEVTFNCESGLSMIKPATRGTSMDAGGGAWCFALADITNSTATNRFWVETRQQSGSTKTTTNSYIWAIKIS